VVFLNRQAATPAPNAYGGGSLVLYGLLDEARWKLKGFPVIGEAGLLVGFRSNLIHEVKPVTHGTRFTIASWLY
jgi:SM-20-related protein